MITIELKKYREADEVALPEAVADVRSMMSVGEKKFLYGYVKDHYAGEGVIVDAGILLGGSTWCFGTAIRHNLRYEQIRQKWQKPIISYDHAVVSSGMVR